MVIEGKWHLGLYQEKGSDSSPGHTLSVFTTRTEVVQSPGKSTEAGEGS